MVSVPSFMRVTSAGASVLGSSAFLSSAGLASLPPEQPNRPKAATIAALTASTPHFFIFIRFLPSLYVRSNALKRLIRPLWCFRAPPSNTYRVSGVFTD